MPSRGIDTAYFGNCAQERIIQESSSPDFCVSAEAGVRAVRACGMLKIDFPANGVGLDTHTECTAEVTLYNDGSLTTNGTCLRFPPNPFES